MKKPNVMTNVIVTGLVCVFALCGCGPQKPQTAGFLTDYSKLEARSDVSYRYLAPGNPLKNYNQFIIDPVEVYFHTEEVKKKKISEQELTDLKNYMHDALVDAIDDRYPVVNRPGPGVARVRVAITDLKKSAMVQNVLPLTKLAGTGLGGATLEAEIIDSQTREQIAAVVESQLGNRLSLDGLSTWGDVKAIMDNWARLFRTRLDEAHR